MVTRIEKELPLRKGSLFKKKKREKGNKKKEKLWKTRIQQFWQESCFLIKKRGHNP